MRKTSFLHALALFSSAILFCQCSVGTNSDFTTGLSYSYNGFSVEQVTLVDEDNNPKRSNVVADKSSFAILVSGLSNFEMSGDKVMPGMMLSVKDKNGVSAIDEPDLFKDSEGYTAEEASVLRGTITVGPPMERGKAYDVVMRVWDKNKPENELTAEIEILIE